jgi:polygalacturonase
MNNNFPHCFLNSSRQLILATLYGAVILLLATSAQAQIALQDGSPLAITHTTGTSISQSFTASAGASVMVVCLEDRGANLTEPPTLAWNNQMLVRDVQTAYTTGNARSLAIYHLYNPAVGTANITGTLGSGVSDTWVTAYTLNGVDTTVAPVIGSANTGGNSSGVTSLTISLNGVIAGAWAAVSSEFANFGTNTITGTGGTGTTVSDGGYASTEATAGYVAGLSAGTDTLAENFVSTNGAQKSNFAVDIFSPPSAPSILTQPQSITLNSNLTAQFSVTATGSAPLHYQWYSNNTQTALSDNANRVGSTSNVLTIPNITANDAGTYSVVITNVYGSVTSSVVTLTVLTNGSVYNVKDFGATGNGTTLDSPAINAAIAAAGAAGGCMVTFPAGNYLCGSIHLTNCMANLTLYLSNNAVIWGSTANIDQPENNPYSQYQDAGHSSFHNALVWGENLQNFTIAGPGKIDGHGGLTTQDPSGGNPGDKALCLVLCSNSVIDGITITNGGHFGIFAQACTNMVVSNARIWDANARDAFDLICSSYVIVTNCDIQGSDDAMCLKNTYALGRTIDSHSIRIVDCQILSSQANATQFGSETAGNFSDVTFSNLVLSAPGTKAGIGITSQDGAIIDGVTYDNITMANCGVPIYIKLDYRTTDTPTPSVGRIRNISINNVIYNSPPSGGNTSLINGYSDGAGTMIPIENITFNNVNIANYGGSPASAITNYPTENQDYRPLYFGNRPSYGWYLRWANNISFTDCSVSFNNTDNRPAVVADTVTNVLFQNFTADVGSGNPNYDMGFLHVANFEVTNAFTSVNAPSPGAALRIFNSNSIPALIVSPPYFSPGDGLYTSPQLVTIASGTPGATIRYTTDGSTPTSSSGTIYSGPITINSETVLLAIAYTNAMVDSAVNTAIYNYMTSAVVTVNTNPPVTTYILNNNNLTLSWPIDHIGWRLLVQTNHLALGISVNTNDWGTVSNSAATNSETIMIDPALPSEFYRLVYP